MSSESPLTPWQTAEVVDIRLETSNAKTYRLRLPHYSEHLAGQHYVVRLTAPDGYSVSRSYSVASPPDGSPEIELTVERLPCGEVSMFLHDEVQPGDTLEVRGPIGGWFVWKGNAPALLVGGGSGIVPLMSMLRLARRNGTSDLIRLVLSVRSPEEMYYMDELPGHETTVVYTRQAPAGSDARPPGHLTQQDIPACPVGGLTYICGSSSFADAATDLVMNSGVRPDQIRIERFSPSGGH